MGYCHNFFSLWLVSFGKKKKRTFHWFDMHALEQQFKFRNYVISHGMYFQLLSKKEIQIYLNGSLGNPKKKKGNPITLKVKSC